MPTPTPKRYYLIRTPQNRIFPLTARSLTGTVRNNKRLAINWAKVQAHIYRHRTPARDRRISVYTVDPGKRPSLLFQCHADRKTGKIVSEQL